MIFKALQRFPPISGKDYTMQEQEELLRQRIAENIAYYRRQSGDTQAELAEKLNYSDKSVSKWERGEGTPDIFILWKIAALYGVTVQDLLREKKVPKENGRRFLIVLLSVGLVWLTMTVLFSLSRISGILASRAWLLFIYGIPIMGIVCEVFSALWGNYILQVISCSILLWGLGLSLILSIPLQSVALLYIVCGVLQVLLILFFLLRHQMHRRKIKE